MHPKIAEAYQLLEISSTATVEEIKKTFRQLAKKYHPDTQSGKANEQLFIQVSEAYELLLDYFSNPSKYSIYQASAENNKHQTKRHSEEALKSRMERAKEMALKNERENQEAIYRAYAKIRTPQLRNGHLIISLICLILNLFITVDYFYPEQQRVVEIQSISNVYGSSRFEKTTALSTYGNEVFYVEYSLLIDAVKSEYDLDSREAFIHESGILKIPRHVSLQAPFGEIKTYAIDEGAYLYFPLIFILLSCSALFYLFRSKKHFKDVILYYTSLGLSLIGLVLLTFNGMLEAIIKYLFIR